jgi:hypothetical protein
MFRASSLPCVPVLFRRIDWQAPTHVPAHYDFLDHVPRRETFKLIQGKRGRVTNNCPEDRKKRGMKEILMWETSCNARNYEGSLCHDDIRQLARDGRNPWLA